MILSPIRQAVWLKGQYYPKTKVSIVYGDKKITWAELNTRINKLSYALNQLGIKIGDKIAMIFHNTPEFIETNIACQGLGAVPVPINYRYVPSELEYTLKNCNARALIFEESALDLVKETIPKLEGKVEHFIIHSNKKYDGFLNYEELIENSFDIKLRVYVNYEDVAVIIYTGGTTGRSKGVMLTYENILFNQEAAFTFLMNSIPSIDEIESPLYGKNNFERKIENAANILGGFIFDFMIQPEFKNKIIVFEAPLSKGLTLPPITMAVREDKLKLFKGRPKKYDLLFKGGLANQLRDFANILPLKYSLTGKIRMIPDLVSKFFLGGLAVEGNLTDRIQLIRSLIQTPKSGDESPMLIVPPLFHLASYALFLLQWVFTGSPLVFSVSKSFDTREILDLIEKEKCRYVFLVPVLWKRILEHPNINEADLNSVLLAVSGAALLKGKYKKLMLQKMPNALVMDVFGQTEMASGTTICLSADEEDVKNRSVGKLMQGIEAKIIDENGNELPEGEVGEICYKGPTIMKGYYNDEEKTKTVIDNDGWFHSGDLACIKDGEIFTVERKKECINTGGEKVFPLEVEEVILENPKVDEVCVIGVPDEEWGNSVRAIINLKKGETATEEEIINWCKGKIASYKKPRSVVFIDEFPYSPVGKILRQKIRDKYGKN